MHSKELHPFIRTLGVVSYLMTILYLVEHFYHSNILVLTYSVLGAILLISAFLFISSVNKIITFILVLLGTLCLIFEDISLQVAITGFGENTNLLSLFLLIPLIGTFMSTAGYLKALKTKVQQKERNGQQHPYRLSYFLTATVGVLLNYGSIAIVKQIIEESSSSFKNKQLTLNIMRGFGFCMLWSPYFVNVGLILVLFNLSWFDIGIYGLTLSFIYLLISWLFFKRISFSEDVILTNKQKSVDTIENPSLTPFFIFCSVLVFLSFVLDFILSVNMLTVVCLLAIVLPFIWAICTRVIGAYRRNVLEQVELSFYRLKNEFSVFISAGYFGMALSYTEIGSFLSNFIYNISQGSVFILSASIVLFAIILAQVGIHPVIIVIGLGSALSPLKFGVNPEYIALILLIAWTTATQMSPFSGQVLMASRLMNESPINVIKQNTSFSLILAGVLTGATYCLHVLGWI